MKVDFNIFKNYSFLLQWMTSLWAATLCFPDLQGSFYGVFALILVGLLRKHHVFSFKDKSGASFWKSSKTPFYFLLAYLIWMTATILWSDDIREYFRQFEKLIPLYLLAFIGFMEGIDKHLNFNKIINAFLWGVLIAIVYMMVRMGVDMCVGDTIARVKSSGIMSLNLLNYINHRTYIGCTMLIAIPLLMVNINKDSRWQQLGKSLFILHIVLLNIMSGARVLMLLSVLITIYSAYQVWGRKSSMWIRAVVVGSVLVASGVLISQNERIQGLLYQVGNDTSFEAVDSRGYIWESACKLIVDKPLFGYGLGDVETALTNSYANDGYGLASERGLNAHNQYLQTTLFGGITGFLLLLFFFIKLLVNKRNNNLLLIPYFIAFGVANLFECMLVRNIGVFAMVFFIFPFDWSRTIDVSKPHIARGMLCVFISFLLLLTVSLLTPRSSLKPNTCMVGDFSIESWDNLPNNMQLPPGLSAAKYDLSQVELKKYTDVNYINDDIIVLDLGDRLESKVSFSIWCYVSNDNDLANAGISIHDGVKGFFSKYDLSNSGSWQLLRLDVRESLNRARFYIMISTPHSSSNVDNQVYYALPKLTINEKAVIE